MCSLLFFGQPSATRNQTNNSITTWYDLLDSSHPNPSSNLPSFVQFIQSICHGLLGGRRRTCTATLSTQGLPTTTHWFAVQKEPLMTHAGLHRPKLHHHGTNIPGQYCNRTTQPRHPNHVYKRENTKACTAKYL